MRRGSQESGMSCLCLTEGLGAALGPDFCRPGPGQGQTQPCQGRGKRANSLSQQPLGCLSGKSVARTLASIQRENGPATKTRGQDLILMQQVDMCLASSPQGGAGPRKVRSLWGETSAEDGLLAAAKLLPPWLDRLLWESWKQKNSPRNRQEYATVFTHPSLNSLFFAALG